MIVKLKKPNTRYRDLTSGQLYDVIGIEGDELRIINNAGRPFLYPPDLFSQVLVVSGPRCGLLAGASRTDINVESRWQVRSHCVLALIECRRKRPRNGC